MITNEKMLKNAFKVASKKKKFRDSLKYIHVKGGYLYSTDSYRLYRGRLDTESKEEGFINAENAKKGSFEFTSVPADFYPEVEKLIPQDFDFAINATAGELLPLAESIVKFEKLKKVPTCRLSFTVGKNYIYLSSHCLSADLALQSEVDSIEGLQEKFEINFDAKFLQDALKGFDKNTPIEIKFKNNSLRPFVITDTQEQQLYLITPVRVY